MPEFYLDKSNGKTYTLATLKADLANLNNAILEDYAKIVANDKLIKEGNIGEASSAGQAMPTILKNDVPNSLINTYLNNYISKTIMTIDNLNGDSIPTFKTNTLTYNDVAVMAEHERIYKGKNYKNLFVNSNETILVGTGTKLEVRRKKDSESADKLDLMENFTSNFVYDFLKSATMEDKKNRIKTIGITLGNYSDKSTVVTKMINVNATFKKGNVEIPILKADETDLLDLVRDQSAAYYKDLVKNIFDTYTKLGVTLSGKFEQDVVTINQFLKQRSEERNLEHFVSAAFNSDKTFKFSQEGYFR